MLILIEWRKAVPCVVNASPKARTLFFCEGNCQQWVHRYCAGVSRKHYNALDTSSPLFLCYTCYIESQKKLIANLEATVTALGMWIRWSGMTEWNGGVDYWSGLLECHAHKIIQYHTRILFHAYGLTLGETTEKQIKSSLGCHAKPWYPD